MKERALHRFDEVFDLQMGKTPDRKTPQFFGGDNVWVSIRDMNKKEILDSNEHITDAAVKATNIRKVKKGTVIMSFKLTVGKCAIAARDLYTNEAIMAFNLKDGFDIIPDFLYYYLQGYKWEGANKAVMGMTLNKATISQHKIAFPPLSEQQSIVAELDKINELITLKKTQLNDLDSLSQSIFCDMFGDPVNGVKYERSTIRNVISNIKYGTGTPPKFSQSGYCFIRATNIKNGHIDTKDMLYIDSDEAIKIEKCKLTSNDLIIVRSGINAGDACNIPKEYVGHYAGYDIIITVNTALANSSYINAILNNDDYIKMIIKPLTRRAAQPHLNAQQVLGMNIPLPPLTLQESFSARISSIEQQKRQICSSINELETLLASRMQYWFD